jgi:hypothetical protein
MDRELQIDDLQNLIDSSIPRPSPMMKHTMQSKGWLLVVDSRISQIACLLATSMKREGFGTTEQYVNALRQAVQNANRQERMDIQPLSFVAPRIIG